jgi:hypothetical protein
MILNARKSFPAVLFLMGSVMISLPSYSYKTIIYVLPLLDNTGKRPVWSMYICPGSTFASYTQCVFNPLSKAVSASFLQSSYFFIYVDLACILCYFMYPFTVDVDLDTCFSNTCSVSPGHDVKFPSLMACIHVDFTRLKHAVCR